MCVWRWLGHLSNLGRLRSCRLEAKAGRFLMPHSRPLSMFSLDTRPEWFLKLAALTEAWVNGWCPFKPHHACENGKERLFYFGHMFFKSEVLQDRVDRRQLVMEIAETPWVNGKTSVKRFTWKVHFQFCCGFLGDVLSFGTDVRGRLASAKPLWSTSYRGWEKIVCRKITKEHGNLYVVKGMGVQETKERAVWGEYQMVERAYVLFPWHLPS